MFVAHSVTEGVVSVWECSPPDPCCDAYRARNSGILFGLSIDALASFSALPHVQSATDWCRHGGKDFQLLYIVNKSVNIDLVFVESISRLSVYVIS